MPQTGIVYWNAEMPRLEQTNGLDHVDGDVENGSVRAELKNILVGMKRRRIVRAVIAYVLALWLVVQLAELGLPLLNLPEALLAVVIGAGIVGLPVVTLLAWLFELAFGRPLGKGHETEESALSTGAVSILLLTVCALVVMLGLRGVDSVEGFKLNDCSVDAVSLVVLPADSEFGA